MIFLEIRLNRCLNLDTDLFSSIIVQPYLEEYIFLHHPMGKPLEKTQINNSILDDTRRMLAIGHE